MLGNFQWVVMLNFININFYLHELHVIFTTNMLSITPFFFITGSKPDYLFHSYNYVTVYITSEESSLTFFTMCVAPSFSSSSLAP